MHLVRHPLHDRSTNRHSSSSSSPVAADTANSWKTRSRRKQGSFRVSHDSLTSLEPSGSRRWHICCKSSPTHKQENRSDEPTPQFLSKAYNTLLQNNKHTHTHTHTQPSQGRITIVISYCMCAPPRPKKARHQQKKTQLCASTLHIHWLPHLERRSAAAAAGKKNERIR